MCVCVPVCVYIYMSLIIYQIWRLPSDGASPGFSVAGIREVVINTIGKAAGKTGKS